MSFGIQNQTSFQSKSIASGTSTATGSAKESRSKELETLKKHSDRLAEILSGSKDSVEISNEARALSEAAKNLHKQEAASVAELDNTTPGVDVPEDDGIAVQKSMETSEGREAIATDYNSVLKELRSKYGAEEAMRRFDEFMQSEGFEKTEPESGIDFFGNGLSGGWYGKNSIDPTSRFMGGNIYVTDARSGSKLSDIFYKHGVYPRVPSNLHLHSTLNAHNIDGKNEFVGESIAAFSAEHSDEVLNAVDSFFNRNIEKLQGEIGFDLASEMRKHGYPGQTSAVSVNKDLAAMTNDILKRAGMELKAGESLSIQLSTDEGGNVTGLYVNDEKLQSVIDRDPAFFQALLREHHSIPTDVESLNGQYSGAGSSVDYVDTGRMFILSGDDPSAMIMADTIGVQVTGYTYQKKVSDNFDPHADNISVRVNGVTDELARQIDDALTNNTTLASTMTKDEYNSTKSNNVDQDFLDLMKGFGANAGEDSTSLHTVPEVARRAQEAASAVPVPTPENDETASYDDGKNGIRQMAISEIAELLNSRYKSIRENILGIFRKV